MAELAYAHSRNQQGQKQVLVDHLRGVAKLAAEFAVPLLGSSDLAHTIGLWHDIGKFAPAFQAYLTACEVNPAGHHTKVDHKGAGARLAADTLSALAYLIQGHHGGLHSRTALTAWLAERSKDPAVAHSIAQARDALPELASIPRLTIPAVIDASPTASELFLRLLFSALVDADFLDTEQHFNPEVASVRGNDTKLEVLWQRFEKDQANLPPQGSDVVLRSRREILQACLAAAERPPGLFRLTVPTGGGKTRSGMAFALRHGVRNGQRRVIVAVPFISITTQTAEIYRQIFNDANDVHPVVLEHHSGAIRPAGDDEDFRPPQVWTRLASENWDAPIVVTTTVQLFESLFANGTSPTRKLHRLANSVIILDEAQSLPSHLLRPILDALHQLCLNYNTTVVLSTATQPAFHEIPEFATLPATEIVPDPGRYFAALKRVEYQWLLNPAVSWADVAILMRSERQSLAIVNTKKDALTLLDALDNPEALHLSTLLCGAHRMAVIDEVKQRLGKGSSCHLVSTQVIEAGVNLDFPLVLRAMGPLDSIVQAAGRCNREGLLDRGRLIVFRPQDGGMPPGAYKTAAGITETALQGGKASPDDPSVMHRYFQLLYQSVTTDREQIQKLRARLEYPSIAREFQMIDDDTESVVVRYGTDDEISATQRTLDQLRRGRANARQLLRQLQPYVVSVRARLANQYRHRGLIVDVLPGLGDWLGAYDPVRGLTDTPLALEALVV